MSTCSNSKMQTADPARTPAFNSNMIFNPQAVSWSVQCPHSKQTLPEHISPKSRDFESWTTHFDAHTTQETEDFSGELNSTTASWSWSKPHSWSRLDTVPKPCGVTAKGQTHTKMTCLNPLIEVDLISTCCDWQHVWTYISIYSNIFQWFLNICIRK